jgi:hypothetical protein
MLTVPFMTIWAGAMASELVSCVDGLLLGPPPGWSPDEDEDEDFDGGDQFGAQEQARESREM